MVLEYTFGFDSINTSVQVGDTVYYVSMSTQAPAGFSTDSGAITVLGIVRSFTDNTITVGVEDPNAGGPSIPVPTDFMFVGKNKVVNTDGVKGYYAKVNLINNSTEYAEIFSIGSEISESSK
jgi:hypothetical protein